MTQLSIDDTLAVRQHTHGEFSDNARIMQKLKDAVRAEAGYAKLDATKREALDMILHKVGRIVSGNPEEPDHWHDIEGYARLAKDRVVPAAPNGIAQGGDALRDVLSERHRQIEVEGFTAEHDDEHGLGEIARAAATYMMAGAMQSNFLRDNFLGEWVNYKFSDVRSQWPGGWEWSWFKPTTPRRDLVKALALGLAEIERLDRLDFASMRSEGVEAASLDTGRVA